MINSQITKELWKRFEFDQQLIKEKNWKELGKFNKENSFWLKKIIIHQGWLSEEKFGSHAEQCAWLIVQHSPDIKFQKLCLKLLKSLSNNKERRKHIAYLEDRILVSESKIQIYGTQFNGNKPFQIKDKTNLDKRRKVMGLEPFEEYYRLMIDRK